MTALGLFSVFALVGIASLVLVILAVVSASQYPEWAFQRAGTNKFVWQILPIILLFVCGFAGGVIALIWFASKRDEVDRAARAGGGPAPYGYGAPPPGWTPPGPPGGWTPPTAPGPPPPPPPGMPQ